MAFRMAPTDLEMLRAIAEYRIMTSPQLAALLSRSKKGMRDRIRKLIAEGLLEEATRGRGQHPGRPERVVFLCKPAVKILKERGLIDPQVPSDDIIGEHIHCQNHQLLLNWVRIHLNHIETVAPVLKIRFLAHNSPFLPKEFSSASVSGSSASAHSRTGEVVSFKPDATFSICDSNQGKTLLFFLEVDLGTETLASPKRALTDIRQKILNYGALFDTLVYKRYERLWNCQLNGFRLLFLTDTSSRMSTLCSLVREMQPSDFIWVTQKDRMFEDGISADIWARGGQLDTSPQSILGRLSCRAPLS
ncbi:MAG: replication-relaxation family protein [Planctomycetota bacterium]